MPLIRRITLNSSQLAAVSRLFSSSVFQEVARKGKSPLFSRLIAESGLAKAVSTSLPVRDVFDTAFTLLKKKNYRHEYVYKAALTHKILLGTHSLHTASMIPEFRVSKCKADIVILNGTSTVYEIKSERDKLSRLQEQISAYRQAFANVNIITGENHLRAVQENVPEDVGILLLTDRYQISTVREAVNSPSRVVPEVIFDSIRLDEAQQILESYGINVPAKPNTQMYQALRQQFSSLDSQQAHSGMVNVLKRTRTLRPLATLIEALPSSLYAVAFSTTLRQQDHTRLFDAMATPLHEALTWS